MENNRTPQLPPVVLPEDIEIPAAAEAALPNGARMFVLPDAGRDVVRFSFVFHAGTSWQHAPFSASATANTISEGSEKMSARKIAEALDFYGSYFDVNIDRDYSVITFVCLARFFEQTANLAREIILEPVFPEKEVRIYCEKSRRNLEINRRKVDFIARERFVQALFGEKHPYGISHSADMYARLTSEDLRSFYAARYTGRSCFVVMSGDTTPERQRAIADIAAELPAVETNGERRFPEPKSEKYLFVPHEGAVQSAVRIGRLLFGRTHPDFIPMQVVAAALGGYFGSRLVHNLREQHGYTYGAYAAMANFDCAGYLAIATEVGYGHTQDTIKQIFAEMERLRTEPVPEAELQLVKNIMAGEVMRILDGPFGIADVTIENVQNGKDNHYLSEFTHRIKSFTPEELLATAVKYLDPAEFTTVVVGAES